MFFFFPLFDSKPLNHFEPITRLAPVSKWNAFLSEKKQITNVASTILLSALGGHSFLQSFSEHSHGLWRNRGGKEPCPTKVVEVVFCQRKTLGIKLRDIDRGYINGYIVIKVSSTHV